MMAAAAYSFIIPNPASDNAELQYNIFADKAILNIYDAIGQKKLSYELPGKTNQFDFDTHSLMQGVYYYQIVIDNVSKEVGKLVIQR